MCHIRQPASGMQGSCHRGPEAIALGARRARLALAPGARRGSAVVAPVWSLRAATGHMRPVPALSSKVGKVGYLALCAISRHVAIETQGGGGAPLPVSPPTGGGHPAKISPRAIFPPYSL